MFKGTTRSAPAGEDAAAVAAESPCALEASCAAAASSVTLAGGHRKHAIRTAPESWDPVIDDHPWSSTRAMVSIEQGESQTRAWRCRLAATD